MSVNLDNIELKNFSDLNEREIKLVWEFRNDKRVASFMKTAHFCFEEHLSFIKALKEDSTKRYFLVLEGEKMLGVIDFINISEKSCEFGLYQNPNLRGYGQVLMQVMLKYAFENLKVAELCACALNENQKAIKLYLKNGFEISKRDEKMTYFIRRGGGINTL